MAPAGRLGGENVTATLRFRGGRFTANISELDENRSDTCPLASPVKPLARKVKQEPGMRPISGARACASLPRLRSVPSAQGW
jgi:hypothetical protein